MPIPRHLYFLSVTSNSLNLHDSISHSSDGSQLIISMDPSDTSDPSVSLNISDAKHLCLALAEIEGNSMNLGS